MSDKLIFDSERQEQRAKKKRLRIMLLVLAALLIAVVVISLLLRSGKQPVQQEGEGTAYPYTWQAQSDGSLLLEISHADAPDYRWTLENGEEQHVAEAIIEETDKNTAARLTLIPKAAGRDIVKLQLLREQASGPEPASKEEAEALGFETTAPEDVLYELSVLVEFTQDANGLTGAVLSSSGVRRQGVLRGGEGSANPYRIYGKSEQLVVVEIKNASGTVDWSYEILSGEDSFVVEGLLYESGVIRLYLMAGETPGESEVVLRSETDEAELRLRCVLLEEGSLLVAEHQAQLLEKPVDTTDVENLKESGFAVEAKAERKHEDDPEPSEAEDAP